MTAFLWDRGILYDASLGAPVWIHARYQGAPGIDSTLLIMLKATTSGRIKIYVARAAPRATIMESLQNIKVIFP